MLFTDLRILNIDKETFLERASESFLMFPVDELYTLLGSGDMQSKWFNDLLSVAPYVGVTSDYDLVIYTGPINTMRHTIPQEWAQIATINVANPDNSKHIFLSFLMSQTVNLRQERTIKKFSKITEKYFAEFLKGLNLEKGAGKYSFVLDKLPVAVAPYYFYRGAVGPIKGPSKKANKFELIEGKNSLLWVDHNNEEFLGRFIPSKNEEKRFIWF